MKLRDEALRHVVGLDSARSAQLSLRVAQKEAQAESGAVLAIDAADRLVFFATTELVQCDTQQLDECWRDERAALAEGEPLVGGSWALIPVGRPVTGLLYLGRARALLTVALARRLMDEIGPVLEMAISMRDREPEIRLLYNALVERTPLRQLTRDKLQSLLRIYSWNKSRVAREMGITRATLYKWIARHGLQETE
jgi:Bacterial regulatory protein, Fis family